MIDWGTLALAEKLKVQVEFTKGRTDGEEKGRRHSHVWTMWQVARESDKNVSAVPPTTGSPRIPGNASNGL